MTPIATVTITNRLTPPVTINLPGGGGGSGGALAATALVALQPAVDVTVGGQTVASWAPAGRPTSNYWWLTAAATVAVVALAAFGLVTLVKRMK